MKFRLIHLELLLILALLSATKILAGQHNSNQTHVKSFPVSLHYSGDNLSAFRMSTGQYSGIALSDINQNEQKNINSKLHIKQFVSAEINGIILSFVGGICGIPFVDSQSEDMDGIEFVVIGAYAGYALGSAFGVHKVGSYANVSGSFGKALKGSFIGVGLAIAITSQLDNNKPQAVISLSSLVLLPPVCSIILYNKRDSASANNTRSVEISAGQFGCYLDACGGPGVKMDLLSCRF